MLGENCMACGAFGPHEHFAFCPHLPKPKESVTGAPPLADVVNQPQHYARWKMQPIEFIAVNNLPFWLANVIKYALRYDAKDGLQDLRKARVYLDMQIRFLEGHARWWEQPVAAERRENAKKE